MLRLNCKITITPGDQGSVPKSIPYPQVPNPPNGTIIEDASARKEYVFDFVNEVEVEISRKNLCSTAKVILPRNITYISDGQLIQITKGLPDLIFRRGDRIKIETGYLGTKSYLGVEISDDADLRTIFNGYISETILSTPIELHCEDDMYILNKFQVQYPLVRDIRFYGKKKKPEVATNKIIPHVIPLKKFIQVEVLGFGKGAGKETLYAKDAGYNEENIVYGDKGGFRCDIDMDLAVKRFDCSAREVFNKLKKEFPGLYVYVKYVERSSPGPTDVKTESIPVLIVSWLSDATESKKGQFYLERNIIDDKSLIYKRQEDIELQCRATGYDVRTGKSINITYPEDSDKDVNSIYAHIDIFSTKVDLSSPSTEERAKATLKLLAEKAVKAKKYEGYRGSFQTFGEPFVRPGDIAEIISTTWVERTANYLIQSVKYTFGVGGYRQEVELGDRLTYNSSTKSYREFSNEDLK